MKATFDLSIGRSVTLKATARTTPAGLAMAALLIAAILVPMIWIVSARASQPTRSREQRARG
jgi:hypothetical protein